MAIEGDIFQDAYQAQLRLESEIYLIPKIGRRLHYRSAGAGKPRPSPTPVNRRPIASPAFPLIDVFGPLFGQIGPLFTRVGYRLVSI